MPFWLWYTPWLVPVALPLVFVILWRHRLSHRFLFFLVSFFSAFGVAFVSMALAALVLEPALRAIFRLPSHLALGSAAPWASYVVGAFHMLLNVGLLIGIMYALRRPFGVKLAG